MAVSKFVSFVIPHKGRLDMLKETLRSISTLNFRNGKIEVVVVSQTPEAENIQTDFSPDELDLRFIIRPESDTISALRNLGAKSTRGKYLAFLDSDIALSPEWLECMIQELEAEENRVLTSGMQVCSQGGLVLEKIRTYLCNTRLDKNVSFLPGYNLFMQRKLFDDVGGFPEHLLTCEDFYFTDKATRFGDLYHSSKATFVHLGEDKNYVDMFKKEMWRGQSNIQSLRGRRISLREWPSILIPVILPFFIFSSLICLFIGKYIFAAALFVFALLPVFLYSFRLYRISEKALNIFYIFKFYLIYFSARALGTLAGLFRSIGANHQ